MHSIILENDALRLRILPRCGGKIVSLFDKSYQHEWLWNNPYLNLREPHFGESYVKQLDFGGWDEVFPSVDPCRLPLADGATAQVPDHGDLVQLPWQVVARDSNCIHLRVAGQSLPFRFERAIYLEGTGVRIDYQIENTGKVAFPWLWCTHPLVPLSRDLTVKLPPEAHFHVLYASGDAQALEGHCIDFEALPAVGESIFAAKLFSSHGSVNTVRLEHRSGAQLRMNWCAKDIPYLGFWVNNGAWSGCGSEPYYNLGIEPATLPIDDLSKVADAPQLAAGQSFAWSLRVAAHRPPSLSSVD